VQVTETNHFLFFLNLNIPINCSLKEFHNMTTNGLHAMTPVMKLKLLPIPNTIKQKTKAPTIKALFLFLNKSRNLFSWDESFILLVPSMMGIRRFSNHFLKTFIGFILKRRFHLPFLADLSQVIITMLSIKYQRPSRLWGHLDTIWFCTVVLGALGRRFESCRPDQS